MESAAERNLTPKQREIRSRESRILAIARPIIASRGMVSLSMDEIARQMSYAKGTIYNHFACKEEILLALAIQATETRLALFQVAHDLPSRPRDRIAAIGVACQDFRERFADLFEIENMVRHATVWDKASDQRRDMLASCELRSMRVVASIGHDAVTTGDLKLARGQRVEELMFGLWSLSIGGMLISDSSPGLMEVGVRDPLAAIRRNCNALLDGFGWQPLYEPSAYRRLVTRVRTALRRSVAEAVPYPGKEATLSSHCP